MARIFLDNDVSHATADQLRMLGHDVVTASDIGRAAATDDDLHLIAAQEGRVLVTHNATHFALLHDAWCRWFRAYDVHPVPEHAGILVIPQPDNRRGYWLADQAAREVDAFLALGLTLTNRFFRWTASQGWRERLQ